MATTSITKIQKRDGSIVDFNREKIVNAIFKAVQAVGGSDREEAERVADKAIEYLEAKFKGDIPTVEEIQDCVEKALIERGHATTAKAYILYRHRKSVEREMKKIIGVKDDLKLPLNSIQVLERRYLLKNETGKPIETPSQLFRRVAGFIASAEKKWGADDETAKYYEDAFYEIMTNFEFLPNSPTLMNAGTNLGQLSACFILGIKDDIEDIFETVKHTAVIHKTGGGCVKKGSRIFSTFCGSEQIERIYEYFENETNVLEEYGAKYINVSNENLRVPSFDRASGRIVFRPVEKVWRYTLPSEKTFLIRSEGGYSVETSEWHRFFVFENADIIEKRADELQPGDHLIISNPSIKESWPYKEYQTVDGIELDEDMAWLTGLFSTDGSIDETKQGLRVRFFSSEEEIIKKALGILERKTGIRYSKSIDYRSKSPVTRITTHDKKLTMAIRALNRNLVGSKEFSVRCPSQIFKSPLSVISAYLAGILDGDGYVAEKKRQVEIAGASREFFEDISSLLYLFGIKSRHRTRRDKRNAKWAEMHEIAISDCISLRKLAEFVIPYIALQRKKDRLVYHLKSEHSSSETNLDFTIIEPFLSEAGIETKNTEIWRKSIIVRDKTFFLARWKEKNKVSLVKAESLIRTLIGMNLSEPSKAKLRRLLNILPNLITAKEVKRNETGRTEEYYDFTVADTNNYLAGNMGLSVVHNTGFCFSYLRPKGDFVKSTAGVASGPLSFMSAFDNATNVIKQGGKRRGANMGILHVWHPDIEEFITTKQTVGVLENFNISVAVDDKFMKAVEDDGDYELVNPRTGQPVRTIKARGLFKLIAYSAWKSAEPGMLFMDTINRVNPTPKFEIHATNPCIAGDTLITTKSGPVSIKELHNPHEVLSIDEEYRKITWAGKTGEREVYKVTTEDGHAVCATSEHKFFVGGTWKPLSQLGEGDELVVENNGRVSKNKIKSIEKSGVAEVFDATEPVTHSFFANGILVHNCGEVPMPDYESCNLGSINLAKFVDIDWSKTSWKKKVNWDRLRYVVRLATQFLDNVVELNKYPIERIREMTLYHRRLGLGVMGFAKMLVKMGIRYDSDEAYKIGEEVMKFITDEARKMSHEMGRARGSFPGFAESTWAKKYDAMRNATVTSIAPTGTISMIGDTSSGIEPIFALAYIKTVMDGTKLYYSDDVFEHVLKVRGLYSQDLMQKIIDNGTIQDIEEIQQDIRNVFVVSYDMNATAHVKMQAAFQRHTDLAVSKTINMPNTAMVEDVENAYMLAWKLGCKGITVYRDGSRGEQVLTIGKKSKASTGAYGPASCGGSESNSNGNLPPLEATARDR